MSEDKRPDWNKFIDYLKGLLHGGPRPLEELSDEDSPLHSSEKQEAS